MRSDSKLLYGIPVAILSFDVVHVDSVVIKKSIKNIYIYKNIYMYTLKKATSVFGCRLSRKLCQCPRITCTVHMAKY